MNYLPDDIVAAVAHATIFNHTIRKAPEESTARQYAQSQLGTANAMAPSGEKEALFDWAGVPTTAATIPIEGVRARVVAEAKTWFGTKYDQQYHARPRRGGYTDCSGYAFIVLRNAGVKIPGYFPTAQGLYNSARRVGLAQAQPGDLVFFEKTARPKPGRTITHVGIYLGDNMMIHCSSSGVNIASVATGWWRPKYHSCGTYIS